MTKFLIIGYGNPLRGDDGVGWHIVEALPPMPADVDAVTIHQLTPEWAEAISRVDGVVFVDATLGDAPGEMRLFPLAPAPFRAGSHETTPDGLLGMAAGLYNRHPPAYMLTITGASFDLSVSLSEPVAAAVPVAVARLMDLIADFREA